MPRALIVSAGNNANEYLARHMADLGYTNIYEFGGINTWPYETEL